MTQIIKKDGVTIIRTGFRIDTTNADEFEKEIQPALEQAGRGSVELDCAALTFMASSGLRIVQTTMRTVMANGGKFKMTNVRPEIYKVLSMTGFIKFIKVEPI